MKLDVLLAGKIALLDGKLKTAIAKKPILGRQKITFVGLENDEQADKRYHGGLEKAVHHYPFENYECWREEIGDKDVLQHIGAFGENFSTVGLVETNVAVGDVFRIGTAVVEISQGRQPCATLNLRFSVPDMALRMQKNGRTGWYYRVLEEGFITVGDTITLIEQRAPEWTLDKLQHYFYKDKLNREALEKIVSLEPLAQKWRDRAKKRLDDCVTEDWSQRLNGKDT